MMSLRTKFACLALALLGVLLLGGGGWGFASLAKASRNFEHAMAVVKHVRYERVYRHRKMRIDREVQISYDTGRYGELHTTLKYARPFLSEGDSLRVLYPPGRPRDIRLPGEESWIWGTLLACGLVCLAGAWLMVRPRKQTD